MLHRTNWFSEMSDNKLFWTPVYAYRGEFIAKVSKHCNCLSAELEVNAVLNNLLRP